MLDDPVEGEEGTDTMSSQESVASDPAVIDMLKERGHMVRHRSHHGDGRDALHHNGQGNTPEMGHAHLHPPAEPGAEHDDDSHGRKGEPMMEKKITLVGGISLIIGVMIGSGIFASPGSVVKGAGSVGMTLVAWVVGGLLALTGALSYVELGLGNPQSGGEFPYLMEAFGPLVAFLFTWTAALIGKPVTGSIICLVFSNYVCSMFYTDEAPPPGWVLKSVAIGCLAVIVIINALDTSYGMLVQTWTTFSKLFAIACISLVGCVLMFKGQTENMADPWANTNTDPGDMSKAIVASLWAYDGWNNLNYAIEEFQDPHRNLPIAIGVGVPLVMVSYCLVNLAYFTVLPMATIADNDTVGLAFGTAVMGAWGRVVISLAVALSAFGAANGGLIGGSRLMYVAAREGIMPAFVGKAHPTRHTPVNALVAQAVISVILLLPGAFDTLVRFFSFAAWIFYGLTVLSVVVMRWKAPNRPRMFKVWLWVPIVFTLLAAALLLNLLVSSPIESVGALVFLLVGVIVYYARLRWGGCSPAKKLSSAHGEYAHLPQGEDSEDEKVEMETVGGHI